MKSERQVRVPIRRDAMPGVSTNENAKYEREISFFTLTKLLIKLFNPARVKGEELFKEENCK